MTTIEARKMFGLKDTDNLSAEGILGMIRNTQEYLGTWSISKYDREDAERQLEALVILYKTSLK